MLMALCKKILLLHTIVKQTGFCMALVASYLVKRYKKQLQHLLLAVQVKDLKVIVMLSV